MTHHIRTKAFIAAVLAGATAIALPSAEGALAQATGVLDVGPQNSVFSGNVRGYWFTAPRDFYITGVDVPTTASAANFNAVIVRFPSAPPLWSTTTTTYAVLGDYRDQASAVTGINIAVTAGDFIGVLGNRGDANSYGTAPYASSILGSAVTLTRLGSQNALSTSSQPFSQPIFSENGGSLSRVFLTVSEVMALIGPTAAQEIADMSAAANTVGRMVVLQGAGVARNRGQDSLTTRDDVLSFTRVADPESGSFTVTQSTMDSAQMMGGIYAWVDLTGFRAEDDDTNRAYSGRGLQIGADMQVMPDMVVGLSLGVEDLNATVGTVNQDGVMRYIQPYMAYSAGAWSGEATLLYGLGDYTQTSGGGTGDGETRLAAITFNGGYDVALDQDVTLTPMLGLAHGIERIEGVSGTLAGAGTETVRFTQASLGAEISQSTGAGEIFAGLHAEWLNTDTDTALVQDLLVDDGWTGRLELGLSTDIGNGIALDTSVALSGLGGDLQSTSGSLRFAFRF
jgi:hypothetical protein